MLFPGGCCCSHGCIVRSWWPDFVLIVAITSKWVGASGPCWLSRIQWHTTFLVAACSSDTVPPSFGWAPSWQTSGSNSQRAPFQTLRLLRGPDWPGDPLTLLQLKATWWPELVGFISFALQMLIKPLWVWAWRKETSKLFADKRIQGAVALRIGRLLAES